MTALNALIATGGTNVASPFQKYQQIRKDLNQERLNSLSEARTKQQMQATGQGMQHAQSEQERAQQAHNLKIMAPLAKSVLTSPNKPFAYKQAVVALQENGIDTAQYPPEYTPEMDTTLEAVMNAGGLGYDPGKPVNVLYKGEVMNAIANEQGNYIDEETGETLYGAIKAPTQTEAGAPGEFAGDPSKSNQFKLQKERSDVEQSTYRNVAGLDTLTDIVASDDFQGGTAGAINSAVASAAAQFRQTFSGDNILNEDGSIDETQIDPKSKFMAKYRKRAINRASYEATIIELAYLKAKAVDPASKITDKDFEFARRMVAEGADKAVILNRLREERAKAIRNYDADEKRTARRFKRAGYQASPWDEDRYRTHYGRPPAPTGTDQDADALADDILNKMNLPN